MEHLTILTGASRGMGLAMAEQLCVPDTVLLCISRKTSNALAARARTHATRLTQWQADLVDSAPVAERLRSWLAGLDGADFASATLINNAGVVDPIGPLDSADPQAMERLLRVDLEAPMQLCGAFLAATRHWSAPRKILNISSGLGRRAMAGSALYCAAKAGMDHFSRCVALDEERQAHPVRIVSLAPGVIDTDMQAALRAGDPAAFPDRDNFVRLKQTSALMAPAQAAAQVLAFLARADFGSTVIADVRDA
ncbi:MAG: SDR family NAD(P)-dependent oxidoreductase [Betaproteobacteria bacterium]